MTTKIKQIKKVIGDVNISEMFEEMMGIKDADEQIIIPKFIGIRNNMRYVYKILFQFSNLLSNDFPKYKSQLDEIKLFADNMKESVQLGNDDSDENVHKLSKVDINNIYRKLKNNEYVKQLVILCSILEKHKNNFSDEKNLKENFILQNPGLTFCIFNFSNLDLKLLWTEQNIKPFVKKYILTILNNLYKKTKEIYSFITSPDVDINNFSHVLISAITELKKHPQLHRCVNAFKRIEQSVELLRDNFDKYYRDSIASENADVMVTSFISDVCNQGGSNKGLTREFRTIINYMHSVSQQNGKNKDPNIRKIFSMLNNNFKIMEEKKDISDSDVKE